MVDRTVTCQNTGHSILAICYWPMANVFGTDPPQIANHRPPIGNMLLLTGQWVNEQQHCSKRLFSIGRWSVACHQQYAGNWSTTMQQMTIVFVTANHMPLVSNMSLTQPTYWCCSKWLLWSPANHKPLISKMPSTVHWQLISTAGNDCCEH